MELSARLRALTRRPLNSGGMVLKVADLSLDTANFEVKRAEKRFTFPVKNMLYWNT